MHVMTCHVGNINSRRNELRRQNGFGKQAIFLNRVPRQAACPIRNGSLYMRHGVKEGDMVWSMSDDVKEAMKLPGFLLFIGKVI